VSKKRGFAKDLQEAPVHRALGERGIGMLAAKLPTLLSQDPRYFREWKKKKTRSAGEEAGDGHKQRIQNQIGKLNQVPPEGGGGLLRGERTPGMKKGTPVYRSSRKPEESTP